MMTRTSARRIDRALAPHLQTPPAESVVRELGHALRTDRRLWFLRLPVRLAFQTGELELEGTVPSLAIKRHLLRVAGAHPAVTRMTDRLRVHPTALMPDAELRDQIVDALLEDLAFADAEVRKQVKGATAVVQRGASGHITVTIHDGVVTLEGDVATRMEKRLAGVLAWWVPGTADVRNLLRAASDEPDSDGELAAAVRAVLVQDPLVDATQVRVEARSGIVTLTGLVWSAAEREQAVKDAWYVLGVADVVNALRVATPV